MTSVAKRDPNTQPGGIVPLRAGDMLVCVRQLWLALAHVLFNVSGSLRWSVRVYPGTIVTVIDVIDRTHALYGSFEPRFHVLAVLLLQLPDGRLVGELMYVDIDRRNLINRGQWRRIA